MNEQRWLFAGTRELVQYITGISENGDRVRIKGPKVSQKSDYKLRRIAAAIGGSGPTTRGLSS
jgi:hypothetical protein